MNAISQLETKSLRLVDIIDFKWLMAHDGVHVHVERLQSDRAYAVSIFAIAAVSPHEAVRVAATRLRGLLGIAEAPADGTI